MTVASIHLQNFRSYKNESFEFESGVNIVVGPNGSGKTNLLEAVLMATKGSSYRGRDTQLIRFGSKWSRIDLGTSDGMTRTVKIEDEGGGQTTKTFEIEGRV